MARIDIRGSMIPNNYKWYYDFFGEDSTCPKDVQKILDVLSDGDDLEVYINSPGGVIDVGSEIYTLLRSVKEHCNLKIYITGEACSAASVVAMAGHCIMSPTALMMVHCVSTRASGNCVDMEHTAEMLRTADQALCSAYMDKTGMSQKEALEMMEHETWLNAIQAKEKGLIDEIMFEEKKENMFINSVGFRLPSKEQLNQVKKVMGIRKDSQQQKNKIVKQFEALKAEKRPSMLF